MGQQFTDRLPTAENGSPCSLLPIIQPSNNWGQKFTFFCGTLHSFACPPRTEAQSYTQDINIVVCSSYLLAGLLQFCQVDKESWKAGVSVVVMPLWKWQFLLQGNCAGLIHVYNVVCKIKAKLYLLIILQILILNIWVLIENQFWILHYVSLHLQFKDGYNIMWLY